MDNIKIDFTTLQKVIESLLFKNMDAILKVTQEVCSIATYQPFGINHYVKYNV